MSQQCDFKCGRPSNGSIGMLRYCRECVAELCGWRANDKRLKHVVTVQLTNGGKIGALAKWVPDCAIG